MALLILIAAVTIATFIVSLWIAYAVDQAARHPNVTFVKSLCHPFDKKKAHGRR